MKNLSLSIITMVMLCLSGCGIGTSPIPSLSDNPVVKKQLIDTWNEFNAFIENGDVSNIVSSFTLNGTYKPYNEPGLEGQAEIEGYFNNYFSSNETKILKHKIKGGFVSDEIVFELGLLKKKQIPVGETPVILHIKYLSAFQKQTDGTWKWTSLVEQ
jgi:ketosteroid isomerase-like protein